MRNKVWGYGGPVGAICELHVSVGRIRIIDRQHHPKQCAGWNPWIKIDRKVFFWGVKPRISMKFFEFLTCFFPDFPFNQWIDGRVGRHHPSKRGFEHVLNQGNIDISMSEIGELWKMVIRTWILKNGKSHHRCIWRSTKWMGSFVQLILTSGLVNRWNIIFGMEYDGVWWSMKAVNIEQFGWLCSIFMYIYYPTFFGGEWVWTIFCQLCRDFAVDQVLRAPLDGSAVHVSLDSHAG